MIRDWSNFAAGAATVFAVYGVLHGLWWLWIPMGVTALIALYIGSA